MAFPVGTLKHEKLKDVHTPHLLDELEAAICSETEADSKITTHKNDASAHHAKTTGASEITSGRFAMTRMPDMAAGKIMVGQGSGSNPVEEDKPQAAGLAVFGDGSDGDITITTNTTLTRDMFYNNLTINIGVVLNPGGYRIFVKGTLTNNGTIARNGNGGGDGSNGSGSTGGSPGVAAAALPPGSLGGSGAGGPGATGASGAQNGAAGSAGGASNPGIGGSSGSGGAGGNSNARTSGDGGNAGNSMAPTADKGGFKSLPFAIVLKEIETTVVKINGGAGGGGGGAGGGHSSGSSGGGGGGGSGGGIVLIVARIINNSNGLIAANGGNGGDAGSSASISDYHTGGSGGGSGGGGGALVLIYNTAAWGTEQVNDGSGGAGAPPSAEGPQIAYPGEDGATGSSGVVIKLANA